MAKQRGLTVGQAWAEALRSIGKKTETLSGQLVEAEKKFPELVTSFRLLLAYAGYRANQSAFAAAMGKFRGAVSYEPDPLANPEIIEMLKEAMRRVGTEDREGGPPEPVISCEDLCSAYGEALQCALEYCDGTDRTEAEYDLWARCQIDIEHYWNQMHERGCFRHISYFERLAALRNAGPPPYD